MAPVKAPRLFVSTDAFVVDAVSVKFSCIRYFDLSFYSSVFQPCMLNKNKVTLKCRKHIDDALFYSKQ